MLENLEKYSHAEIRVARILKYIATRQRRAQERQLIYNLSNCPKLSEEICINCFVKMAHTFKGEV